jgi:hypothetical protein
MALSRKLLLHVVCTAIAILPAVAQAKMDARALEVIDKSRVTRASYFVISTVEVNFKEFAPDRFIGGEFHSGIWHRIEDKNARVVANCETRLGYRLMIASLTMTKGADAAVGVCGVGERDNVEEVRWLGIIRGKFGAAERVRIIDREYIRTYDILPDGAIVKNIWQERGRLKKFAYRSVALYYCKASLQTNYFTESSLLFSQLDRRC